jgi:hypothetical protein
VCARARARVRARVCDVETSERDHLGSIWAVAPQEREIACVCVYSPHIRRGFDRDFNSYCSVVSNDSSTPFANLGD